MAFEYLHPVCLDDVDRFEITFYPQVFVWFQRASEALFREGGRPYPEIVELSGCRFPIVTAQADYTSQIEWGQMVELALTVSIGRSSFRTDGVGRVEGEHAFDVTRTQVAIDDSTGEKTRVPDVLVETVEPFLDAD